MASMIPVFGRLVTQRREFSLAAGQFRCMPTRTTISVEFPDLVFNDDETRVEKSMAEVIAATVGRNLLSGRTPSGDPAPSVSPGTLARREYRERQADRGGQASARIVNPTKRSKALQRFVKRFTTTRGLTGDPRQFPREWFGVESGLLASSAAAGRDPRGGYAVYFASVRGKADRAGTSAATRVFSRVAPWSKQAMEQPAVQSALQQAAGRLFTRRAGVLLANLKQAIASAEEIGAIVGGR